MTEHNVDLQKSVSKWDRRVRKKGGETGAPVRSSRAAILRPTKTGGVA